MFKQNIDVEAVLVQQLLAGNEEALIQIYNAFWDPLFTYAYKILKDRESCEDVVQDVFLTIWQKRERLEIRSLKSYLFASVRYAVIRIIKEGNVKEELFEGLDERLSLSAQNLLELREFKSEIEAALNSLPEKCRDVYRMSREEELSHKEISERLQISVKTVEYHITKAIKHLRTVMSQLMAAILMVLIN